MNLKYFKNLYLILNNFKFFIIIILSLFLSLHIIILEYFTINLNNNYIKIKNDLKLTFNNSIKNKIRIGIFAYCIKNGGRARISALLINNIYKYNIFDIYLYTKEEKEKNEYNIPLNIKRKVLTKNIVRNIQKDKINILIYQLSYIEEIEKLNNIKNIKIIYYLHSSFLFWVYSNYSTFKSLYKEYIKANYIITLIPLESDYLFKKWGINSILMDNFISYNFNLIFPSDLSSQTILMIGRGNDRLKRFELGIEAMAFIIKEIPNCKMIIISELKYISYLQDYVKELKLEENIEFVGFTPIPEIYFKNASLHIFPTITEAFPMVLCETKIYGIPNILIGIDYISIANGGTIIIYNDNPEDISNEAIKILKNKKYRKKLGKEARKSMRKYNNNLLNKKWIKLILSIYNGNKYYEIIKKKDHTLSNNIALKQIQNQINLLKKRIKYFNNKITIKNIENFTFLQDLDYNEEYKYNISDYIKNLIINNSKI